MIDGCWTVQACDRMLAHLLTGEPLEMPGTWWVALNRVECDEYGTTAEPHPETNYRRLPLPRIGTAWLGFGYKGTEHRTAWQNRQSLAWTVQEAFRDKWLPIRGYTLFDAPEGGIPWMVANLACSIDDNTYDPSQPTITIGSGHIYVTGIWPAGGPVYLPMTT